MNRKTYLIIITAAVLLLATSCSASFIVSLTAEAAWTEPLGSLVVTCTASSPGGELSYQWSASGGNITGTGPEVTWSAPAAVGMYDITVVVTDSEGAKDTQSIALVASSGPPPVIEDIIVTADHEYLKATITGYKVARTYDYDIECIASSTSGAPVYEWSCDGGQIAGEGATITWTAPDEEGNVRLTVKVFDDLGNWVWRSIVFDVVRCENCIKW